MLLIKTKVFKLFVILTCFAVIPILIWIGFYMRPILEGRGILPQKKGIKTVPDTLPNIAGECVQK